METTDTQTKTILLFAYGTLRRDERLHDWLKDDIITDLGKGTAQFGRLFYSTQHKAYPYFVFTGVPSDRAIGEVYELPLNEQIHSMLEMEVNAGYTLADTVVTLDNGEQVNAIVCAWKEGYGEPVPNNDWRSAERTDWWV